MGKDELASKKNQIELEKIELWDRSNLNILQFLPSPKHLTIEVRNLDPDNAETMPRQWLKLFLEKAEKLNSFELTIDDGDYTNFPNLTNCSSVIRNIKIATSDFFHKYSLERAFSPSLTTFITRQSASLKLS